ncbi:hypothetical protein [Amphibacillus sediminis]|nr:hypothetical protein [Amphibacillus sediminis]
MLPNHQDFMAFLQELLVGFFYYYLSFLSTLCSNKLKYSNIGI